MIRINKIKFISSSLLGRGRGWNWRLRELQLLDLNLNLLYVFLGYSAYIRESCYEYDNGTDSQHYKEGRIFTFKEQRLKRYRVFGQFKERGPEEQTNQHPWEHTQSSYYKVL